MSISWWVNENALHNVQRKFLSEKPGSRFFSRTNILNENALEVALEEPDMKDLPDMLDKDALER